MTLQGRGRRWPCGAFRDAYSSIDEASGDEGLTVIKTLLDGRQN
jgi:hypothetical protein